ncbi:MAG: chemotaxis protein CheW [Deltaproteobacteria bacterium]|nr:chemotaxis protein CheW [Deltaproteobacteria bacterium]
MGRARKKRPEAAAPAAASPRSANVDAPRPPPSVRVSTETLDRFLSTVGEVILNSSQVRTAAESGDAGNHAAGLDRMDRVVGELQRRALELRTTPLLRIVEPLPRMARDVAQRLDKRVEVELRGGDLELDRSILDRLSDPLVHLVRNAVDHGIEEPAARLAAGKPEAGRVVIDARRENDTIRIAVRDDGAGMDLEAVRERAVEAGLVHPGIAEDLAAEQLAAFVFHPGLSTAKTVSEISGRGVGMDAVRATLDSLGGSVEVVTYAGQGTTTTLTVPITAAVQRVLLLEVEGECVALPIARVERIVELQAEAVETSGSEAFALVDDEPVPVLSLAQCLRLPEVVADRVVTLVLTEVRGEMLGVCVRRVLGQQQIYVKPVPELLASVKVLAGLTILGDGRPVFVLEPNHLL